MGDTASGLAKTTIVPAPACDLIDRLSNALGLSFTITDLHGVVVASTAGLRAGTVDEEARKIGERGSEKPSSDETPRGRSHEDAVVYAPIHMRGRMAGVLIAHGTADDLETTASIAAVAIGMALDFADGAASLSREKVNASWLLYRLLRGSREDAHQARIIAAIFGWNLFVRRVALVAIASGVRRDERQKDTTDIVRHSLGRAAADTPLGQIGELQWVALPRFEPGEPWQNLRKLAERLYDSLSEAGYQLNVGIGQPHLPVQPVVALRRSYREAVFASRMGAKLSPDDGVHDLRGLGSAAFFAPSTRSRNNLADVVIEPLAANPGLLETLRAYFASNMSVARAADALNMHRHTVKNHLDRVTELTGRDPRDLDGAVQLKLALLVHSASGSP